MILYSCFTLNSTWGSKVQGFKGFLHRSAIDEGFSVKYFDYSLRKFFVFDKPFFSLSLFYFTSQAQ